MMVEENEQADVTGCEDEPQSVHKVRMNEAIFLRAILLILLSSSKCQQRKKSNQLIPINFIIQFFSHRHTFTAVEPPLCLLF